MSRFSLARLALAAVLVPLTVLAQEPAPPGNSMAELVRELQRQVAELRLAVSEIRAESSRYRSETEQLRRELQAVTAITNTAPAPPSAPASSAASDRVARLQEQYDILSGKVDEQYQTKVESDSRYRAKLSGIVLLNLFNNRGAVDNLDIPQAVRLTGPYISSSAFGGTIRQSEIGFEVFGPTIAGARTRAAVQFDFAGGFPDANDGAIMGIARLRTGTLRLDWPKFSVVAGQDTPIFSPLSPTSVASLAQPALSYAGNLWTWVPQLRAERRFVTGETSSFTVQAGIMDPLSGEPPAAQFYRVPQAGEASRQPGYATRIAWSQGDGDHVMTFGASGYYSRQNWGNSRTVDAWAGAADWAIPFRRFSLTGEFYRGRALGGFGGGVGQSALLVLSPAYPTGAVRGLDSIGGWTQLKLRATPTLEFNAAVGQDNPFARQIRYAAIFQNLYFQQAARNRSSLVNFIYRPRSDLLFSLEYRHLRTFDVQSFTRSAEHINATMGVLF